MVPRREVKKFNRYFFIAFSYLMCLLPMLYVPPSIPRYLTMFIEHSALYLNFLYYKIGFKILYLSTLALHIFATGNRSATWNHSASVASARCWDLDTLIDDISTSWLTNNFLSWNELSRNHLKRKKRCKFPRKSLMKFYNAS